MNTPRFSSAVVVLLIVVLLAVLVVLLVVLAVLLIVLVVVLIGHDNYLLLKECNSSMSIYGCDILKI